MSEDENTGEEQTVLIGETELALDEAKALVEQGKTFKELSEQYPDIDWKELPKSFTQTRQELAELKKPKSKETAENLSDDEAARQKQIRDFFSDPLVQAELEKKTAERESALREDLEFQKIIESLESEFDGSDGRPKFVKKDVLKYGMENKVFNPRVAYKEMHEDALAEWRLKKTLDKKRPSTFVERRGGQGGSQPDVKTPTNFREATAAALSNEE